MMLIAAALDDGALTSAISADLEGDPGSLVSPSLLFSFSGKGTLIESTLTFFSVHGVESA